MKKEVIVILAVLLFAASSYAACDITATIDEGVSKSYTSGGKDYTIKFSSLKNESGELLVKFEVNGKSTDYLEQGQKYSFEDLSEITIQQISLGSGSENDSATICLSAGLVNYGKGSCSSIHDCDDSNPCTIDECDGDPLRCHHKLILWCRDDDGCCPESRCTPSQDNDCLAKSETTNSSDISINSSLINGSLNQTPKEKNLEITECISGDNYCPDDCTFGSDKDCDECSINDDCDDDNTCTSDSCSGTPKVCINNATSGCNFNGTCVYVGKIIGGMFCSKNNLMEQIKSKNELCDNNYECISNICKKNKCKSQGFIIWLKGLFGK